MLLVSVGDAIRAPSLASLCRPRVVALNNPARKVLQQHCSWKRPSLAGMFAENQHEIGEEDARQRLVKNAAAGLKPAKSPLTCSF